MPAPRGLGHRRHADRAALGGERDRPRARGHRHGGGVQAHRRVQVEHAERARADQAHAAAAADGEQLGEPRAALLAAVEEAAGEHEQGVRPGVPARARVLEHLVGRDREHREVGRRARRRRRRRGVTSTRSSPAKPASRRLRITVAPAAVPPTVTSTTDAGRSTCATAAAAAARPRSSKRSAGGLAERRRHDDLQLAGRRVHLDGEAGLAGRRRSCGGSTGGRRRRTCARPSAAATPARCASRIVAIPRPCHSSATSKAISARSGDLQRVHRVGDDPLGLADRDDDARAVARVGARRRGAVEVRARRQEAQPARVLRHRRASSARRPSTSLGAHGSRTRTVEPSRSATSTGWRPGRARLSPRARSPACRPGTGRTPSRSSPSGLALERLAVVGVGDRDQRPRAVGQRAPAQLRDPPLGHDVVDGVLERRHDRPLRQPHADPAAALAASSSAAR